MTQPSDTLTFRCGAIMKNRFMLAPLTNTQSHEDGTLSEEEFHWLTMRARGGFGLVMTCASHVQANGKGFPGQLGIFGDQHILGHQRLAGAIQAYGSVAVIQLYHGGMRADPNLIEGPPVCPSTVERKGARALTLHEIWELRDDFITAAERAQKCGYSGVEIHGAHGYIIAQFLSAEINKRADAYGGSLENRTRLLFEIVQGIRQACGDEFLLGVRLSPERFGMQLSEIKLVCQRLIDEGRIDFLDLSLWDCFKEPEEPQHQGKTLLNHITELDYKEVKLTVAGKIRTANDVSTILNSKVDFVTIGRAAILHHDFPQKVLQDNNFEPVALPVSRAYLEKEGLSDSFVTYMQRWAGFVED
ncbi:MAG: NADH:flavin oxidoreductase [Bacteroidia bacterium]|nr:NADH:flavin oxidoreductase [Bacteroidia bacterium]